MLLWVNTLVVAFLVGVLLTALPRKDAGAAPERPRPLALPKLPAPAPPPRPHSGPVRGAVSWAQAEKDFAERKYEPALARYQALLAASAPKPAEAPLRELLTFRMAQCLRQLGDEQAAGPMFDQAAEGSCAIVRAAANYWVAAKHLDNGEYLQARMRACMAVADLGTYAGAAALETDCDFLVGRALTQKVLAFSPCPVRVTWPPAHRGDLFAGLPEAELRELLGEQASPAALATLGPQIGRARRTTLRHLWSVTCRQASLEELLQRFASQTGLEVRWLSVSPPARRRAVSVHWAEVSEQRLAEVACGSAGLIARFTGDEVLIEDPLAGESLTDQRRVLFEEAVSSWRRFFLRTPNDDRVANARFALGAVFEATGDPVHQNEAMREYRLVAHRFSSSPSAPEALLRAAKLRIDVLKDYEGAYGDLEDLLDAYPHCRCADQVYLLLGELSLKTRRVDQAVKTFRRLYYLNLSFATRVGAALGVGRCEYQRGNHQQAIEWLQRYIDLATPPLDADLAEAHVKIGRSLAALGRGTEAMAALYRALGAGPSDELYVEAVLALARLHLESEQYVAAIGSLRKLGDRRLGAEETYQLITLEARAYREMKLLDRAIRILRDRMEEIADPQMRALAGVELARCHAQAGDLQTARKMLADVLVRMKPGPAAWNATCDLAEVCLKLGETVQAIIVARGVLKAPCPEAIRQRALEILVAGYVSRQDYAQAAGALPDAAPVPKGVPKP